jgi:hypothetical protein
LCKHCKPGKCIDCPSKSQPAEIECPDCNERGCSECEQQGYIQLTSCPKEFVGREISGLATYADLFWKGLPPIAGGVLDQSNWFIEASQVMAQKEARLKAELGVID